MPARAKGVRLYLRRTRGVRGAHWVIRDRGREISTGCDASDLAGAEEALREYLGKTRLAQTAAQGSRSPDRIQVADVIALYAKDIVPRHARPSETSARLERLNDWWGHMRLSSVNGPNCRSYAKSRTTLAAARRELEELRAAINHYHREGMCPVVVPVVLPDRGASRERWCTRDEIAKLLWTAWKFREHQRGEPTDRRTRRHVARFILTAVYTGTRAGSVCAAALGPAEGRGWIDLERGIFYRRPDGVRETKKRRPAVPLPDRLLAHLRRWKRTGHRFAVEFNGESVKDCDKAFRHVAHAAGLGDVSPHVLRHTAATWLMQSGCNLSLAAGYLGMTVETLERVYGHHHPDHLAEPKAAIARKPVPSRPQNDRERTRTLPFVRAEKGR